MEAGDGKRREWELRRVGGTHCLVPLGASAGPRSPRSTPGGSAVAERYGGRALPLLTAGLVPRRRGWGAALCRLFLRGARREPLDGPPAAKTSRPAMGVRVKKGICGNRGRPKGLRSRWGPIPRVWASALSPASVESSETIFFHDPRRASPGVVRALQSRRGEGLLLLPACAPTPEDPEMKPVRGKGWAPAGRELFLP